MDTVSKHPTRSSLAMHTQNGVFGKLPGRCHAIQCIDSTMLPRANHPFGCIRSKPTRGSVPDGL